MRERAQLFTLEGVFAGLIILAGLLFAIQATTTSPGTAGGPGLSAIDSDQQLLRDTLQSMEDETIREAVMYWSESGTGFHCNPTPTPPYYYPGVWDTGCSSGGAVNTGAEYPPPNEFGAVLKQQFDDGYNYNVRVGYITGPGTVEYQQMVYQGEPGAGAVEATRSVPLTNDQEYYTAAGNPSGTTLEDDFSSFYAPPMDGSASDNNLYNVLYVEVVLWRA